MRYTTNATLGLHVRGRGHVFLKLRDVRMLYVPGRLHDFKSEVSKT